jgi:hypothetical protein
MSEAEEEGLGNSIHSPLLGPARTSEGDVARDADPCQWSLYTASSIACLTLFILSLHLLIMGASASVGMKPDERLLARMDFSLLPHQVRFESPDHLCGEHIYCRLLHALIPRPEA